MIDQKGTADEIAARNESIPGPAKAGPRYAGLFFAIVAVYCLWVFSLPLFPSQDGPMHLYYTQVLSHVLSGSRLFSQFFAIRFPPPPYILPYGLLLVLTKFVSAITAEKCVVCLFIVAFAYGFRYFGRSIGPGADLISLWVVPLSLNWALGMGFYNFCLSMAAGFWAMGMWLIAVRTHKRRFWIGFLLLIFLMLLTHPVPLLITLAFITGELLLRVLQGIFTRNILNARLLQRLALYKYDALVALLAYCSIAYIALFMDWQRSGESVQAVQQDPDFLLNYFSLKTLSLIGNRQPAELYCWSLYPVLVGALVFAFRGVWRRLRTLQLRASDVLLAASLAFLVVTPFLPASMNGSDFFADRLLIYAWIAALAAACGSPIRLSMHRSLLIAACVFASGALFLDNYSVRPVAELILPMETTPVPYLGATGAFIYSPKYHPLPDEKQAVTFNWDVWVAARYFRRADAVMLNAPWLDLPISPLQPQGQLFVKIFPKELSTYPDKLRYFLMQSEEARNRVGELAEFLVFTGVTVPKPWAPDPLLQAHWPHPWNCQLDRWYSVCNSLPDQGVTLHLPTSETNKAQLEKPPLTPLR